jgi:hypothetical protein
MYLAGSLTGVDAAFLCLLVPSCAFFSVGPALEAAGRSDSRQEAVGGIGLVAPVEVGEVSCADVLGWSPGWLIELAGGVGEPK